MSDLSSQAWEQRYQSKDTPWDLNGPTPEFVKLFESNRFPQKGKVLIPGAGRGYDAVFLAKKGYEVEVVDFAPSALQATQEAAFAEKVSIYTYPLDFFELGQLPYHSGAYDFLLEYTFFCAIDPQSRKRYVEIVHKVLKPGGYLVGLFFPLSVPQGHTPPPYPVNQKEIEELFAPYFDLKFEPAANSVGPRAGREILGIFQRKK